VAGFVTALQVSSAIFPRRPSPELPQKELPMRDGEPTIRTARAAPGIQYAIVIEKSATGCSAYAPDVPGCVATAATEPEVEALMREALEFHFEGLRINREPIPESTSRIAYLEVQIPD
jgi:predicted RNase H-like HicB family nuclease